MFFVSVDWPQVATDPGCLPVKARAHGHRGSLHEGSKNRGERNPAIGLIQIIELSAGDAYCEIFQLLPLLKSVTQQIAYRIDDRLYLSITDRCTLECGFCPKNQGSYKVHEYDLTIHHRPDANEIIAAIGDPAIYEEVVFCGYGEPTLRLNVLLDVARFVKAHGGRVRGVRFRRREIDKVG